jgi:hypothetical protein
MKGTLHKTEQGWQVSHATYHLESEKWTAGKYPLHPDFIEMMDTCFTSKFTQDVEFEIVTEWENGEVGVNGLTYAKLVKKEVPRLMYKDGREIRSYHSPKLEKILKEIEEEEKIEQMIKEAVLSFDVPEQYNVEDYSEGFEAGFEYGAKWYREKIINNTQYPY